MAGRPSKYKPEFVDQVYKLCTEFGADDKKLAKFFSVTVSTINKWKIDHPEFSESIKKGKDEFDTKTVEVSLFQRACGYSHPDVHISNFRGEITVTEITKHYPPDTTAIIFYLVNRQPHKWQSVNRQTDSDDPNKPSTVDFEFERIDESKS